MRQLSAQAKRISPAQLGLNPQQLAGGLAQLLSQIPHPQALLGPTVESEAVVGWGQAARWEGDWDILTQWLQAKIDCDLQTRPLIRALVTLSFAPEHTKTPSVLIIPAQSIVFTQGQYWYVQIGTDKQFHDFDDGGLPQFRLTEHFDNGILDSDIPEFSIPESIAYPQRVQSGLDLISDGVLFKIVLATQAHIKTNISPAQVAHNLALEYPSCWIYTVDGFTGATPELLLRIRNGVFQARVLAGTVDATSPEFDQQWAQAMKPGGKNRREHALALESLVNTLTPYAQTIKASKTPFQLKLPNVAHLASDVQATLHPHTDLPQLLRALHPTAAVGGTPTNAAVEHIAQLEGFDRGRFAGPVGWLNPLGDAELALGLRCGQFDGTSWQIYAGAGIVAGSDPQAEWSEVNAKMRPMRNALRITEE